MINKLIIDGENVELNESSKMPYTHTFQQAKTHVVKFGLDKTNEICAFAFKDCTNLTKIEIPEAITMLKRGAFMNCSSLPSITLHEGINYIGNYCFDGCTNLTEINFEGDENRSVPNVYCIIPKQTTIYIPDGSKYVEVPFAEIDTSGDIDYFTLESWGEYVRVEDLSLIDPEIHYYRNKWDAIGDNIKVKENKNRRPVTKLLFNETEFAAIRGNVVELEVNVYPEDCTNLNFTWTSSAPDIIKVMNDDTGNAKSKYIQMLKSDNSGTAVIECKSESGISAFVTFYISNPILSAPVISVESGKYTEPQTITITANSEATIYYTTNGYIPTRTSTKYTGPFEISTDMTIKAIAVKELGEGETEAANGMQDSSVTEETYTFEIAEPEPESGE